MSFEADTDEADFTDVIKRRQTTLDRLPSMLTVDEASAFLRVNRKTVYEAVKNGSLPGAVRLGSTIRISKSALLAWMARQPRSNL